MATAPLQSTIPKEHPILTYLIASVWLINGFLFKVLNLVPRHEEIVARILGDAYSGIFIIFIGVAEIAMGIWILSGILPKLNALLQISIIATMNVLEIILAPDLLLWGRWNGLFAFLFTLLIYYNAFRFKKPQIQLT